MYFLYVISFNIGLFLYGHEKIKVPMGRRSSLTELFSSKRSNPILQQRYLKSLVPPFSFLSPSRRGSQKPVDCHPELLLYLLY